MAFGRIRALALAALMPMAAQAASAQGFVIGTGGVTGVYFPAGGAICLLVNEKSYEHRERCALTSTAGSLANLRALDNGEIDFAVVQSDWHHHAVMGTGPFETSGPMEDLRSVLSLHPEAYTVVVRAGDDIAAFEDLKGRRLNAGTPGSGQRATTEVLLGALGWSANDFAALTEVPPADQPGALCGVEIDAMVYVVGHPSSAILEATSDCDARILEVTGPEVEDLTTRSALYEPGTIPGGVYRGNDEARATFSIRATLVTRADVAEAAVHALVASVLDQMDRFRALHPAFEDLDPMTMATDGLSAPLHPGAERYFKEVGLPATAGTLPMASSAPSSGTSQ